jgi:hypothetical protein
MKRLHAGFILGLLITGLVMAMSFSLVSAGNVTLSLNSGDGNVRWFVSGEASLILNGFDLDAYGVPRPTQVDRLSISVLRATPGRTVEAVVYQDADGGSPVNARLLARKTVDIQTTGIVSVTLDAPVSVTDRFLWVGFYLPVDFEFNGDNSGSSVLTYWGWTPGSTFDLTNLGSAAVFGPADGSSPVNINMSGKARINVEVITTASITGTPGTPAATVVLTPGTPIAQQIQGGALPSFSPPMTQYTDCGTLLYDQADIGQTYSYGISIFCKPVVSYLKPEAPDGYNRQGPLYDVYVFGVNSGLDPLPYPVTHCIKPKAEELNTALVGLGQGAPREWEILPTVRYGEYICAELDYAGFVSYFVPKS